MKKIDQINEKLNKGRERLKEIEKKYDTDSKKILELRGERAVLMADQAIEPDIKRKEEIKNLSKQIDDLKKTIETRGPELVSALGKKLQGIESERVTEELRLSFEKQKKLGAKICDLSGKLIENLGQANSTNEELNKVWDEYINLSKATKKPGFSEGERSIRGSSEGLKFLWNILNYEYTEGKPRERDAFPMGMRI